MASATEDYNKYVFFLLYLGPTHKLCLKDISQQIFTELRTRLESDPVSQELFYQSFGLDRRHPGVLSDTRELFPDTPVRLLKDIFEALKLYDLAELLEKAKPRTLRPALPLKEIEKLPNASNRPATFYKNAAVLIIDRSTMAAENNAESIGSFFKATNLRSEINTITTRPLDEISNGLMDLQTMLSVGEKRDYYETLNEQGFKTQLANAKHELDKELLKTKVEMPHSSKSLGKSLGSKFVGFYGDTNDSWLRKVEEEVSKIKIELEKVVERRKYLKEKLSEIEKEIEQKKEELQRETEKFQTSVSAVIDGWVQNEGWWNFETFLSQDFQSYGLGSNFIWCNTHSISHRSEERITSYLILSRAVQSSHI